MNGGLRFPYRFGSFKFTCWKQRQWESQLYKSEGKMEFQKELSTYS